MHDMLRENVFKKIHEIGIIPVVVLNDANDAIPLAKALCDGGLACAEITFRTDAAEESIQKITKQFPEMLIGAGTILTKDQIDRALAAGASFLVSPGFNPKIVKYCEEKDVPLIPGACTPSELEQAIEHGLDVIKFFPAEAAGGLSMIKALAAPYSKMKFMPTGGITPENVTEYLRFHKVVACGGSWMVKDDLIAFGNFAKIKELAREAAAIVKEIRTNS